MKRINFYTVRQVKESGALYDLDSLRISSPEKMAETIETVFQLKEAASEHFGMFSLNNKNKIVGAHLLFIGTLNSASTHPREVFKAAMLNNAASIIVFHNHPSGDPTPSGEDIAMTERLAEAGAIIGIRLLDHIIIGDTFVSLAEQGFIHYRQ